MKIRLAAAEDFERVCDFYWEVIDLIRGVPGTAGWQKEVYPKSSYLRESIEKRELFILEEEGRILSSVILNSNRNEGYEGLPWTVDCPQEDALVIHTLAVHPGLSGKGYGRLVVSDIIEIARQRGKKAVRLDMLTGNVAAEHLYTGTGFKFIAAKDLFYEDTGWTQFRMYELPL